MKIVNRKKFIIRILEVIVIIATIILTILAVKWANQLRGYKAYGGEWLISVIRISNNSCTRRYFGK